MTVPIATTRTPRAQAARRAGFVGGFFALGLGLSSTYALTGVGITCPFRAVTGWDCPFCGATRMGAALLSGDVSAALVANPLVLVGLIALAGLGLGWFVEAVGGGRSTSRVLDRASVIRPVVWAVLGSVVALAYTLVRNLL